MNALQSKPTFTTAQAGMAGVVVPLIADETDATYTAVYHSVACHKLGIHEVFADYATAFAFAKRLQQQHPRQHIEQARHTKFINPTTQSLTGGAK